MPYQLLLLAFLGVSILEAQVDTLLICRPGQQVQLNAPAGQFAYEWFPAAGLSTPSIANPTVYPVATTLYVVRTIGAAAGPNLIRNPDFSEGNEGFTSDYTFVMSINIQGRYGVNVSAANLNAMFFADCPDHTTGVDQMMIVDGSPIANERVWCQTVTVMPDKEYAFSTWLASVNPSNPARLQFSINGMRIGQIFTASNGVCDWRQFYATWNAEATTEAEICVVNQNTNPDGNDFALDDFAFFELEEIQLDSTLVLLSEANHELTVLQNADCGARNGAITITTATDQRVAFDYALNSGSFSTEETFSGLAPGVYEVSVRTSSQDLVVGPCLETFSIRVPQGDCPIYLPTAFSPNGDGVNDRFRIFTNAAFTANVTFFQIYDRWGGIVFAASDPASGLAGWDGRVDGVMAAMGTYVYRIELEGTDGVLTDRRGSFMLLR